MSPDYLDVPTATDAVRVGVRLMAAMLLGGLIGAEREWVGKAAGLRTHMLVSLGAALFVIAPLEAGASEGDIGRIVQGIAAGIGFIGAGTILKRADRDEIHGLTTAAGIWLTAGIGVTVGLGQLWVAMLCTLGAWVILFVLGVIERRRETGEKS
jgi:putative Mg2+ transporter-C (MgtC) family protein